MTAAPIPARTSSPDETRALAAALAAALRPGDLILLVGDLGAGKTTFTQGLAAGLGVVDDVTSPTFTLVRSYPCGPAAGAGGQVRTLLHADLYRLDRLQEVVDLGLAELVEDASVAVVEWGDVGAPVFGPDTLTVALATGPADEDRTVTLRASGSWSGRRSDLRARLEPWAAVVSDDGAGRPGRSGS